ncbi:hypothetical protein [Hwangdonia lutea]|uniref:Uncharacterized protein n=1 Tax=Hwangdonia lutea TaxID=3075823 RepID=A0AA97HRB7_9FLAO|nr:hypothetical protein [Hwangdonia sp. SCSIO 19198]WOD44432.1 hypothetical protein RNZ46_04060 [Hwangdonia sp. SCSIO 19198]
MIYSAGDSIAALLIDEFSLSRLLGMMLVGATFYAFEIPNYFDWIVKKTQNLKGIKATLTKTLLAIMYFNPLWVARHLLFIKLFSGAFDTIGWNLLEIAFWSFSANILISFIANYIIQNRFKHKWRFLGSAIFSAIMAIYYALSETFFG